MANEWNFDHIQRTTAAYVEQNYMTHSYIGELVRQVDQLFIFARLFCGQKKNCRKFSPQISCRDLGDYSLSPFIPPSWLVIKVFLPKCHSVLIRTY